MVWLGAPSGIFARIPTLLTDRVISISNNQEYSYIDSYCGVVYQQPSSVIGMFAPVPTEL